MALPYLPYPLPSAIHAALTCGDQARQSREDGVSESESPPFRAAAPARGRKNILRQTCTSGHFHIRHTHRHPRQPPLRPSTCLPAIQPPVGTAQTLRQCPSAAQATPSTTRDSACSRRRRRTRRRFGSSVPEYVLPRASWQRRWPRHSRMPHSLQGTSMPKIKSLVRVDFPIPKHRPKTDERTFRPAWSRRALICCRRSHAAVRAHHEIHRSLWDARAGGNHCNSRDEDGRGRASEVSVSQVAAWSCCLAHAAHVLRSGAPSSHVLASFAPSSLA